MITVLLLFKFEQKLRGRPFWCVPRFKVNDDDVLRSSCTQNITTYPGLSKDTFRRHTLC